MATATRMAQRPDPASETASRHAPALQLVYYAFPSLIFGFYLYFYLQSRTWQYYFSGAGTRQPSLVSSAFLPGDDLWTAGFFFLPIVP